MDAAVSSLDSVNHITDEDALLKVFSRVRLFLNPGGVFIFDALTPAYLTAVSDSSFIRETPEVFCAHSVETAGDALIRHTVDLFIQSADGRWTRETQEHIERMYPPDTIIRLLTAAGFSRVQAVLPLTMTPYTPDAPRVGYIAHTG